jgi:hypothetical protein
MQSLVYLPEGSHLAASEHHLSAIESQRMDADLDLAFVGGGTAISSIRRTSPPPIS